jgi:phenylalanyl-tRNA synthetase alpha chain
MSEGVDAVQQFESGLLKVRESYGPLLADSRDEPDLRARAAKVVGPQGELTLLLKLMRELPGDKRKEFGQRANALKQEVEGAVEARLVGFAKAARDADLNSAPIDVSLPGRRPVPGRPHALRQVLDELVDIFGALGFEVADGPEVELYEYNFTKLGFPPDHPATDMQDSFFVLPPGAPKDSPLGSRTVLRTHTSGIQVREMLKRQPPLAIIAPRGSVPPRR